MIKKLYWILCYGNYRPESTPQSLLSSELATPQQISTILTDEMLNNESDELNKLKVCLKKLIVIITIY